MLSADSDYPYRDGRFPLDAFPPDVVLGVQCNICIDDFRADNAATMFCLGSHKVNTKPPAYYNEQGNEGWLPPEAVQLEAPAGSAIVYDSRMWVSSKLSLVGCVRVFRNQALLHSTRPARG